MKQKNRKLRRAQTAAAKKKPPLQTHRDARGRLHLALHRDPLSGREQLSLVTPLFKEAWQNRLATAAAKTAHGLLHAGLDLKRTIQVARHAMNATSHLSDSLLKSAPTGALACKAACDHCCHQSVGITPPEALAIFDYLKTTRDSDELSAIAKLLKKSSRETKGLSSDERFSPEHPCPFLESWRCSIYEARPLSCRGMNSLNAEECANRLRNPELRAKFLRDGLGGQFFMEPIRGFHAISAGLQISLRELYHLDMRPLDLTAALHLLFNGPESIAEEWLSGLKPFESALSSKDQNGPLLRELSGSLHLPTS